jgi:sulfite oxidase
LTLSGYALVGDGRHVARVDVSLDGGHTWAQADLQPQFGDWTWRRWSVTLCADAGPLHVTVRAWDDTGSTQPESAATLWNPKGYANNSWAHLDLHVT